MPVRQEAMTAENYREWLEHAHLTAYAAAPILGISRGQSHKYARGEQPISATVAKLIYMLRRHGIPRAWRA